MVASEPELDFEGLPRFLIDSRTKGGMSGSLVIARRQGSYSRQGGGTVMGGQATRFLGVYSGRMRADLDLGIVWKKDDVVKVIEQHGSLVP